MNIYRTPADFRPEPTQAAITVAVRNAAKAEREGYEVKQSRSVPHVFYVIKYSVDTLRDTCNCEQDQAEGTCKHKKLADDYKKILEGEEIAEERGW
jgi:hypothetical protein